MTSPFIDDGCTEQVFIKGIPGLYDDVRLFHRPMTIDERYAFLDRIEARHKANMPITEIACKEMAKRFVDTSLGEMTAEKYGRLKPALWERLYLVLLGRDGGDLDPSNPDADTEVARTMTLEEKQGRREKNSEQASNY